MDLLCAAFPCELVGLRYRTVFAVDLYFYAEDHEACAGLVGSDYLRDLGVTAVELLPVFEFDENENANTNPRTGETLVNYWGYSTIGFFAPKTSYAADRSPGGPVREFK